jgi:hypothetical protein
MNVFFDLTALYVMGELQGVYEVRIKVDNADILIAFQELEKQHPVVFDQLKTGKIVQDDGIKAMMISREKLLTVDSLVEDNQRIKVIGQICGG